jgi:hypothetical protein
MADSPLPGVDEEREYPGIYTKGKPTVPEGNAPQGGLRISDCGFSTVFNPQSAIRNPQRNGRRT